MVAHLTLHTYGIKHEFRFVEGIWLHRKSSQNRFFLSHHYLGPGLDQPPYFHRDPYTEYTLAFMGIRARQ